MSDIISELKQQIADNRIILFMKGTPEHPQCGFSSRAVQMLKACGEPFAFVDVLAEPEVRANLPRIANWPTFPQLFVNGELVGGCDIMMEMYQSGELKKLIQEVANS
jgi:monothiol glutaredoxin